MNTYIIIQIVIGSITQSGNVNDIGVFNIIRVVIADTEESAIGKFVIDTMKIKGHKKLDIECYLQSNILTIV